MTSRRSLGAGPQDPAAVRAVRATQADLLDELPGIHLPDLEELRARGVLGSRRPERQGGRRTLGAGITPDTDPAGAATV
ncbi:hypothetical protein [Streptomyces sp. NPDC051079]|uniref:hypothetical protein n=1 Tax=Streptomyces sp. NPDC051079 TaxID=3155043 RepID=UPI00344DFDF6